MDRVAAAAVHFRELFFNWPNMYDIYKFTNFYALLGQHTPQTHKFQERTHPIYAYFKNDCAAIGCGNIKSC